MESKITVLLVDDHALVRRGFRRLLEDEDCIMLARILKERDLMGSSIGTMAISCAAIDDISAWLLLAVLK
jgi:DNA-binding NarL/FixJ family response regulator